MVLVDSTTQSKIPPGCQSWPGRHEQSWSRIRFGSPTQPHSGHSTSGVGGRSRQCRIAASRWSRTAANSHRVSAWTRCISRASRAVVPPLGSSSPVIVVLGTRPGSDRGVDACGWLCVATGGLGLAGTQEIRGGPGWPHHVIMAATPVTPTSLHSGAINNHSRFRISFAFVYAAYRSTSCCSHRSMKQSDADNRRSSGFSN